MSADVVPSNPVVQTETNRDKALRGEVVEVSIGRLLEMREQAIRFEGVWDGSYHWHWAAALNELIARRQAAPRDENAALDDADIERLRSGFDGMVMRLKERTVERDMARAALKNWLALVTGPRSTEEWSAIEAAQAALEAAPRDETLPPYAFICPACGQPGLHSIYASKDGKAICTACANRERGVGVETKAEHR